MLILDAFVLRLLVSLEILVVFLTLIGHANLSAVTQAGLEVQEPICFVIREVIADLRWLIP